MKEKVEKQKKIGNGFGFGITQFILYLLATIGFVIGCIVWYAEFNHSKSFKDWIDNSYYYKFDVDVNENGLYDDNCYFYDYDFKITIKTDNGSETYRFVSEDMNGKKFIFAETETGKPKDIKFTQIYGYKTFISNKGWIDSIEQITMYIFVGLASFMGSYAFLQALATFLGRKSIKANNLGIVINSIMVGYGVFGLVGGVKGRMYLQFTKLYGQGRAVLAPVEAATGLDEVYEAGGEESTTISKEEVNTESGENREIAAAAAVTEEEEIAEYIQPKMGKKGKTAIMITLIASYALLLLAGILLAAVPSMSKIISGMGICEEISARAYGITIGVMWVALVPSLGYYFATVSPFEPGKKVRIIVAVVSALLSVAMVVVFFVIINAVKIEGFAVKEFYEGSDSWFIPLSMVFAALGFMICHALTLFKINPAKIRNKKPEKCGDGLFSVLKYVFALLIYGILGLVKFILTCKEKQPDIFILVSTILLTWLVYFASFVFAIICIVVMVGVIVMYFAGVIAFAYTPSSSSAEKVYYTDAYGNKIELTEQPYVKDDRYQKVYKDEYGNEYISDDGGKHVHKYGE